MAKENDINGYIEECTDRIDKLEVENKNLKDLLERSKNRGSGCTCYINHGDGDVEEIIQCSLCKASPRLLMSLKNAEQALERIGAFIGPEPSYRWLEKEINEAIEEVEKK